MRKMQLINKFIKKYIFIYWYKKQSFLNPWYYQNKQILKVFKRCPIKIHIGKYKYMMFCDPVKNYPIQLSFNGLGWKERNCEPVFEYPPNILFKLFNFSIRIIWTWGNILKDMIYWEGVLQYFVYKRPLRDVIETDVWINNKDYNSLITLKMLKASLKALDMLK